MNEREMFEAKFGKPEHWIKFDAVKNKYTCEYNSIDHHLLIRQARWEAWQASDSREGYKLVPVDNGSSITRFSTQGVDVCSVSNTNP